MRWRSDDELLSELTGARPWLGLRAVVGGELAKEMIMASIARFDRTEALLRLSQLAAVMANTDGGILGAEARAYTRDLLSRPSEEPLEKAVAEGMASVPHEQPIAHAHVVFALQAGILAAGGAGTDNPSDAQLAFLMLAMNDHLHEWIAEPKEPLTEEEVLLGSVCLALIFNRSEDPVRFITRSRSIFGRMPSRSPISTDEWRDLQQQAFGCSYDEYFSRFLGPLFMASSVWGTPDRFPALHRSWLNAFSADRPELTADWVSRASRGVDAIGLEVSAATPLEALPRLPSGFYRTALLAVDDNRFIGISPWHVKDHISLGTWGKLNDAAKEKWKTGSNQRYSSHFGNQFEEWCAERAREAAASPTFRDDLILPSQPGASDEIEDVVFRTENAVALFSAKASLVPEERLKTAADPGEIIAWLKRLFFEPATKALKKKGQRGGVVVQLDKNVRRVRAGEFEGRGIRKNAVIFPVVLAYDNVCESSPLYSWIESECERRGLLRDDVRPVTIAEAKDYELLLVLGMRGVSICELLREKTEYRMRLSPLDLHIQRYSSFLDEVRMPSMKSSYEGIGNAILARVALDDATHSARRHD